MQRIVLRDARAVLGGASPESQRCCVRAMQDLLQALIDTGVVQAADAQALASLVYGSLAEAAFWIAEPGADAEARLQQGQHALQLLLGGLQAR